MHTAGLSPEPPGRLRYLEGLVAAASAINATLDLPTVLQVLVDRATELLGVPAATVMLLGGGDARTGGDLRVGAARGLSTPYLEAQRGPLDGSIAARALAEGRVFATWDVRQTAASPAAAEAASREGIASVACAPMIALGRPVGVLNLYCRAPEQCFSPDQFHVLSLLAAQGAVAITNARLYKESRAQAREVQASFGRVGAALASSLDVGQTLKLIVQLAGEMTRAEGGAMFMLEDGSGDGGPPQTLELDGEGNVTGSLLLSAARGLHRRSLRLFRRVPVSPLAARTLATRKVILVPDTRRYPDVPFPSLRPAADGEGAAPDGLGEPRAARSAVCVPVLVGERPVGVLEEYATAPNHFSRADVLLLESFALQAAVAIENARLYAQERNVARTLQRSFLPDLPDSVGGFEIGRIYAASSESASVGGDIYDLLALHDGRIAVLIADVSGHGLHAATLTGMAKYTVRAYALEDPEPSSVLARLNDALAAQTEDSIFLTLCYALIDPRAQTVKVASAAHPPALLYRAVPPSAPPAGPLTPNNGGTGGGRDRCLPLGTEPGLIAGFRYGETYASQTAPLRSGDVLVFYTDGVIEARRRKIMFEGDRLRAVIEANASRPAQQIAAAIYDAVAAYVAPGALTDDIALLVLKVL